MVHDDNIYLWGSQNSEIYYSLYTSLKIYILEDLLIIPYKISIKKEVEYIISCLSTLIEGCIIFVRLMYMLYLSLV